MPLPATSVMDPSVVSSSGAPMSGSISNPSIVDATSHHHNNTNNQQQQQTPIYAQSHQIQIPGGAAMSIGSLAVAMGLSGTNSADPNSLTFTSSALATLSARMGMSSMAGTNTTGLVAPGNSLVSFPGNTALNLVPGMNLPGGSAGVSLIDGSINMVAAGGMAMHSGNVNLVPTSNEISSSNIAVSGQQPQQQQQQQQQPIQHDASGNILPNNIHLSTSGDMVNNLGGSGSGGGVSLGTGNAGHPMTSMCCGGCKNRVTVKDQFCQTDLSTVLQVKTEERLARSGLMPGARLISHSQGTTISHASPSSHHGPNMPCSCDFCGRMFAKKEYLRRHIRIHTGERPYKCVICGHSFRRSHHLRCHELTHSGTKPYSCNICGKAFYLSHHLRCHELTHTGTKPYSCNICGKAFNLSHHLRRHEMTHTGEKPYACSECGKAFTRKQHLDRHYKTHTGEYHRTFKCPFCEKMFYRAHHRDKHMKRHGEVLTTPDLTVATFSPVNNMNLSIRPDGTLRADGLNSSPISVGSKDDSHSSEDYLTSDEEGGKSSSGQKPPKEGSKKRKGSSPVRLRFPYDSNTKDMGEGGGMKLHNMEMNPMKNMGFSLPHGTVGSSGLGGAGGATILATPTRGRPKGSKNKSSRAGMDMKKNSKVGNRGGMMNSQNALGGGGSMEMKTERMDGERELYGGVIGKKEGDSSSGMGGNSAGIYGGKAIPNIPQQFASESVVVRHPLQGVTSPHSLNQQPPQQLVPGEKGKEGSTPGPVPTPTQTPTPDGRNGQMQWPNNAAQQMNPAGGSNPDYMPGMSRPGGPANNGTSNGTSADVQQQQQQQQQQTCHYKPPTTPDQNLHHSWASAAAAPGTWPRLTGISEMSGGPNAYGQMDASRFMNLYSASKAMEMRMADLRGPHGLDSGQWNQGRRDHTQEKGGDSRIYSMHQ